MPNSWKPPAVALHQHIQGILSDPLNDMPKHYPGAVVYQKDTEFTPISRQNLETYQLIGTQDGLMFIVHPAQEFGFVFSEEEVSRGDQHVLPVMRVAFRSTPFKHQQAYRLRIRESFSRLNIATLFYLAYAEKFGGIVSDREHLEGGRSLWGALLKIADTNPRYKVLLGDVVTGEVFGDATSLPLDQIWSHDDKHFNKVLILSVAATEGS